MQSALALLTEALSAEAPERPAGPEPVYSPREAASRAARLGRYPLCQRHNVHGAKARYVPNLSPHSIAVAPASDHRTVRVEAWPVGTSDEAVQSVCELLGTLAGRRGAGPRRAGGPAGRG